MLPYNIPGVIYLAANYSSYEVNSFTSFLIVLFLAIGSVFFLISIFLFIYSDKNSVQENKDLYQVATITFIACSLGISLLIVNCIKAKNFIPESISYDVMITNKVNYNELTTYYTVINTRENIVTIEAK